MTLGLGTSLSAQTSDPLDGAVVTQAAMAIVDIQAFVDGNNAFCRDNAPNSATDVKRAVDQWHATNATQFIWMWAAETPEMAAAFQSTITERAAEIVSVMTTRAAGNEEAWCQNLPSLLADPQWDLFANFGQELAVLRTFQSAAGDEGPLDPIQPGQPLAPIAETSTVAAIAAGYDPDEMPLPGEYRCYEEDAATADHATLIVQFPEPGVYKSSFGNGNWALDEGDFTWTTGPFADANSYVYFDENGSRMSVTSVERNGTYSDYDCPQAGPSDQALAISVRLLTPQIGNYSCTDVATNTATPFQFLPALSYQLGSELGSYTVSDLLDGSSSTINWITGPFAGETSFYSEEEGTGAREFSISVSDGRAIGGFVSSSSSLSLVCEGRGLPVRQVAYGPDPAPPVPAGTQTLSGQFYRYEGQFNGTFMAIQPQVYTFYPTGYVYIGPPDPGVPNDCTKTRPNGAPACDTYQILGNQIVITYDGEPESFVFAMNGGTPVLDDEPMLPVRPATVTSIEGHYWANYFSGGGICGEFSSCSSTYIEWNYLFLPGNEFIFSTDSSFSSMMSTAIASTSVGSNSSDSDRGTYTIEGNTITYNYDNGTTQSWFFLQDEPGSFIISDQRYTPKEEE